MRAALSRRRGLSSPLPCDRQSRIALPPQTLASLAQSASIPRRTSSRTLVAAMALVLSGCPPAGLDVGEECSLASDCREPYVCLRGRCRVECLSSRLSYRNDVRVRRRDAWKLSSRRRGALRSLERLPSGARVRDAEMPQSMRRGSRLPLGPGLHDRRVPRPLLSIAHHLRQRVRRRGSLLRRSVHSANRTAHARRSRRSLVLELRRMRYGVRSRTIRRLSSRFFASRYADVYVRCGRAVCARRALHPTSARDDRGVRRSTERW